MSGIDRRLNGFSEPQSQTFVWVRLADLQRKSATAELKKRAPLPQRSLFFFLFTNHAHCAIFYA